MHATSPSSSTTTPSPSLPFLQPPGNAGSVTLQLADLDPHEREERQRAVQKFLARAECSKLTRSLRARLAYASYKATHDLSHVPLPDLEHRIHTPSPAPSPSPVPPSPYSSAPPHKHRADAMPPPASPSRSLYSSLLGPPPSKRPRHVYTPAEFLPPYGSPTTPSRRKAPASTSPRRTPFVNGGQGRTVRTVLQGRARSTVTEKEDMNAAATLTALMYNRASPQSRSDDGGVPGMPSFASLAPPRTTTPGPAPELKATEDADAAELMLYLATSPSPARPTVVRRAPGAMGRVLFAGARGGEREPATDGDTTPALTTSQSSLPSSQDTVGSGSTPSRLLPPPPSPSPSLHRSSPVELGAKKPVSRRLFADTEDARLLFAGEDDAHRMTPKGAGTFGLGKGIDLVQAQ